MFQFDVFSENLQAFQFLKCQDLIRNHKDAYTKFNKLISFEQYFSDLYFTKCLTFEFEDEDVKKYATIKQDMIPLFKNFENTIQNIELSQTLITRAKYCKLFSQVLLRELELLNSLLICEKFIAEYSFKEFLIEFFKSRAIFGKWVDIMEPKEKPVEKKLSVIESLFYSSDRHIFENRFKTSKLHSFYISLFESIISKSYLYFYSIVESDPMKKGTDYPQIIHNFQQMQAIHTICVVYNTHKKPIELNGYSFLKENEPLNGIKSLPCIFCQPKKKLETMSLHWGSVSSIILSIGDSEVNTYFDPKVTYFCINLESNFYMVVTFESAMIKSDKKVKAVTEFLIMMRGLVNNQRGAQIVK